MLTVYFLLILYYSSPAAFSPAEPDGIFVFIVGGWSSSIIIDMLLFVLLFVLLVLYLHNIFFLNRTIELYNDVLNVVSNRSLSCSIHIVNAHLKKS